MNIHAKVDSSQAIVGFRFDNLKPQLHSLPKERKTNRFVGTLHSTESQNIIRLYYDVNLIISYNSLEKEGIFIIRNIKEDRLMKKKLGLLLATIMVVNTVSTMAFAWENPLKKYNLYEDVTGGGNAENERVMDEYNSNSLRPASVPTKSLSTSTPNTDSLSSLSSQTEAEVKGRNETLRESSRNVYGDPESVPGWEVGPSFYPNPSFESIREKYHRSDFAGCLQECISYVRLHPYDTLGFYYLAMCYSKVSDKDNAVLAYEKVISLNANPMIVKYATNGRNCVMGNGSEQCYQDVNIPELKYPYRDMVNNMNLTPVDPQTLVNRNLAKVRAKLSPAEPKVDNNDPNSKDKDKNKIQLPFGQQDESLDKFINSPYGNGLSPELNKEYKQLQLRKIQETINTGDDTPDKDKNNRQDIKKFDKQKTDAETIKLAYDAPSDVMTDLSKNPEYIQQKKELEELNMLLGNEKSSDSSDIMNLLPYMSEQGNKNLSPEVIQAMMMKSMMGGLSL